MFNLCSSTWPKSQLRADWALKEDLPPIQRWLNRLLALPIGLQNLIFDEFLALVETRVAAAREAGTLDVGVETMPVETATVLEDTVLRTDPVSGATSHLLTIEVARRRHPVSLERAIRIAESDSTARFLRNGRSGKVALSTKARSGMTDDGTSVPRIELMRPTRREYLREFDMFESAWEPCSRKTFEEGWTTEAEEAATRLDHETVQLATGLLLPIWSALPSDHLEVNRIVDAEGRSWLGRIVFPKDVAKLLTTLGVEQTSSLTPAQITAAVVGGSAMPIQRPFPCELKRSRVNGSPRIEIVGAPASQLPWLKSLGCFSEIISYRTRVFVPAERASEIIERLVASTNPEAA